MSGLIPDKSVDTLRTFNDLAIELYGIDCDLFVPTNLTTLEPNDMYTNTADVTFTQYEQQKVWIQWYAKGLERLRKLGIFSEKEIPIIAWFKNDPEVTIGSYIKVESRYIPDNFDTDEFEIVNVIMKNFYDSEIYRCFKLAPRRKMTT